MKNRGREVLGAAFTVLFLISARAWSAPAAVPANTPQKKAKVLPGQPVQLKTKDGWTLAAQYEPAKPSKLTLILLHQTGGRKEDWYYLARALTHRGIGVFALDLRGHGESQNPPPGGEPNWHKFRVEKSYNEWINMALDVQAAVDYLVAQNIPETEIGIGGADVGSSLALRFAAVDPKIPLVFMLSPGMSYREVLTVNAMRAYVKRPILMVVGADDRHSVPETALLYQFAKKSAGGENVTLFNVDREHGTRMLLVNRGLITRIADWIENPGRPSTSAAVSTPTPLGTPGLSPDEAPGPGSPEGDASGGSPSIQ